MSKTVFPQTPSANENFNRTGGLTERFWSKVNIGQADECWPWLASIQARGGYGHFSIAGKLKKAHRVAFELMRGPIPVGLALDHLCRNRACVNPSHLEPVTFRENVLRGEGVSAKQARRTHCPSGHEYAGRNLILVKGTRQHRICRECANAWHRRNSYKRRKVAV